MSHTVFDGNVIRHYADVPAPRHFFRKLNNWRVRLDRRTNGFATPTLVISGIVLLAFGLLVSFA
jgi:hypothetical protein